MCFENGLPRQSADWLAMTGFFDSLYSIGGLSEKIEKKSVYFTEGLHVCVQRAAHGNTGMWETHKLECRTWHGEEYER